MAENFYYLASYTAALAAGFAAADALAIAKAARYVDDCEDFTVPGAVVPEGSGAVEEPLRIWPVFHYLPGDPMDIMSTVNPAMLNPATPELLYGLPLVCRPGGRLIHLVIEHARKLWDADGPREARLQTIGIAMHTLADTFLHQGFAGVSAPTVNAAETILISGDVPREGLRQRLEAALDGPLEAAFEQMQPYVPEEPPVGTLGCEQLGGLADRPGAVFTYLSPWPRVPAAACVNPLRFAAAYQSLRGALRYIRGAESSFEETGAEDRTGLLDLAVYFASVPKDVDLPETWFKQFRWAYPEPCAYRIPAYEEDEPYIRGFKLQAQAQRTLVMDACLVLRDYIRIFAAANGV